MPNDIKLSGCRHDILGHYLKAIGLLRVLAKCAAPEHRDLNAEGWWNNSDGAFYLRSEKYNTAEKLTEFFEKHYRPTPVFSAWNTGGGLDEKQEVVFKTTNTPNAKKALKKYLNDNIELLKQTIKLSKKELKKPDQEKLSEEKSEYVFDLENESEVQNLPEQDGITISTRIKESGKKSVMVHVGRALANEQSATAALKLGREYFEEFQADDADMNALLKTLRDLSPFSTAEALDSVFTTHTGTRHIPENPVFLSKGEAGAGEIFRTFWSFYLELHENVPDNVKQSLCGEKPEKKLSKAIGTPFFPDAIKTYNFGAGWVENKYPFVALDYILAVEGAFAMRGSVSRTLGANTRRFAAFPFVFDSGEDMVDDGGKVQGTASSLWFPLWERPTTYEELASFICDAQARLPRKEARFSAEFLRAIHSQGVDAGFSGWQEFRFRMKGSRVPWVTAGHFSEAKYSASATLLNRALEPFDATHFIEQFEIIREGGAVSAKSPHRIRAGLNAAIENALVATTAENCIEILCAVFAACRKLAISKSFRENSLQKHPPRFFEPLPMSEWNELLHDLENVPEFEIARAVASIVGLQKQNNDEYSKVQPLLGSLLPLKCNKNGWYLPLPDSKDRSNQAVWAGVDLCHDLAAILQRRYMDSAKDDYPALQSVFPARIESILAFFNGELDDHKIARWIEALSLIDWHFDKHETTEDTDDTEKNERSIPLPYAALRSLLDAELAYQKPDIYKRRRSEQPVAQLCVCSPHSLAQATAEALRFLSFWGVENPWGKESRAELPKMQGAYIVRLDGQIPDCPPLHDPARIAAATAIPLHWRDRWQLRRLITLPVNHQPPNKRKNNNVRHHE